MERWYTYESHAASKDHENDERLEVLVLYQLVHDKAPAAPDLAWQRVTERVYPRALADAVLWAAVIRILQQRQSRKYCQLKWVFRRVFCW